MNVSFSSEKTASSQEARRSALSVLMTLYFYAYLSLINQPRLFIFQYSLKAGR